jgi:hypothetical protein
VALKRFTTEEMVQISGPWCTKSSPAQKAILAAPDLAGLLPRVQAAHQGLHAAQPTAQNPRLAAIAVEAKAVDDRHDDLVRGTDLVLEGLALLAGAGAQSDALTSLRSVLAPEGLSIMNASYRTEAGAAALLKTRLAGDAASKRLLKDTPAQKKSLLDYTNERFTVAAELGALEDERASLLSAEPAGPGAATVEARNLWIRTVNAFVANADLAALDKDSDTLIFGALRQAEKKADRRGKAPAAPVDPVTPPPADPPAAPDPAPEVGAKKRT